MFNKQTSIVCERGENVPRILFKSSITGAGSSASLGREKPKSRSNTCASRELFPGLDLSYKNITDDHYYYLFLEYYYSFRDKEPVIPVPLENICLSHTLASFINFNQICWLTRELATNTPGSLWRVSLSKTSLWCCVVMVSKLYFLTVKKKKRLSLSSVCEITVLSVSASVLYNN